MVVKIRVEKNVLKNFQMSEQNWSCLDKMSEVNFSPAETLKDPAFLHADSEDSAHSHIVGFPMSLLEYHRFR